jgi:uncharacterized protein with HEPN domain
VPLPSERPLQRLQDILDNIERIERFTAGKDFEHFAKDEQALYASLYALLVISEPRKSWKGKRKR